MQMYNKYTEINFTALRMDKW